jgi:hypothetical protein
MLNTVEEIFGNMHDIQERTVHMHTGVHGMEMISHAMAVSNATDYLEWAIENNKIEKQTGERLIEMLNSPDHDNANLAILAIKQLSNEYSI